jgi:hypothetical protein
MKTCAYFSLMMTAAFMLAVQASAAEPKPAKATSAPEAVVYDARSAFEFLKTLSGAWERSGGAHDHGGDSHVVTFRNTAGGSSVMETIFPGEAMEMISMYHMDGDTLLLTHYCALQNAPVLKFEKSGTPGEIKFVFHGGTNFDPKVDPHVHEGVLRIKDANVLESSFVAYSNGKPDQKPSGTLKRKTGR